MKLSKALLGAILVGVTVQTTSCGKKGDPKPKETGAQANSGEKKEPFNCPACGLG